LPNSSQYLQNIPKFLQPRGWHCSQWLYADHNWVSTPNSHRSSPSALRDCSTKTAYRKPHQLACTEGYMEWSNTFSTT